LPLIFALAKCQLLISHFEKAQLLFAAIPLYYWQFHRIELSWFLRASADLPKGCFPQSML